MSTTDEAVQEPCGWQFYQDGKWHNGMETNNHRANTEAAGFRVRDVFPAAQPAVPDFKSFKEWAAGEGYDVAYTHDGIKWVCLNPMTADLWCAWQAAHGITGKGQNGPATLNQPRLEGKP
jgi:hypothetical protein